MATQRSWKNAQEEWSSKTEWHRICVFRPRLAEYVATAIKKGSHILVEGELVVGVPGAHRSDRHRSFLSSVNTHLERLGQVVSADAGVTIAFLLRAISTFSLLRPLLKI